MWKGAGMGTAEHPPTPCMAGLSFWGTPSNPKLMPRAWSSYGYFQSSPQTETGCRASHRYKQTCSEQPSPQGCSLQLPKPHLLGGCDVSSQRILAVPRGCSSRVSGCLGASIKWFLQGQGQGQGRAGGQQLEWSTGLPAVRGEQSIHTLHLGLAPSSLLSHGSCSRLKWRSCSRAAGAVQLSGGGWSWVFPFWLHVLLCKASKGFLLKLPPPVFSKHRKPQAHYMWTHCTSCVDGQ